MPQNTVVVELQCKKPAQEDLFKIIRDYGIKREEEYWGLCIKTQVGKLLIRGAIWVGYELYLPDNCNCYKMRVSKEVDKKMAEWICKEWEHLSWMDFHYVTPPEYNGNDPQTLDELCVYYRALRQHINVSDEEKKKVARRFLDLMFEETKTYAAVLDMPFNKLRLFSAMRNNAVTNGQGSITYNPHIFYHDADSIRAVLVHELCHSVELGHGKRFSIANEEAMLTLGLIPRPCAYSEKLSVNNGPRFPIGQHCPGYDFFTYTIDYYLAELKSPFLGKFNLWRGED